MVIQTFISVGSSLRPLVANGQRCDIAPLRPEEIRRGDVVLFTTPGPLRVCHRVIALRTKNGRLEVLTKGDALRLADGWSDAGRVLGKLIRVEGRPLPRVLSAFLFWRSSLEHFFFARVYRSRAAARFGTLRRARRKRRALTPTGGTC